MSESESISHFWVAGPPFCFSTILVASGTSASPSERLCTKCDLFDTDGTLLQSFQVESPADEVGVIELEPFMGGLKMQSGILQGHVIVHSHHGVRHICRQQIGGHVDLIGTPREIKSREMSFIPLLLGGGREHLLAFVNTGTDEAQVVARLLYGNRSPEWTLEIPGNGCRVVSLEHELLATFDDSSWRRSVMQGYVRISPRLQSSVVCQMIEKTPMETKGQELYRCMSSS